MIKRFRDYMRYFIVLLISLLILLGSISSMKVNVNSFIGVPVSLILVLIALSCIRLATKIIIGYVIPEIRIKNSVLEWDNVSELADDSVVIESLGVSDALVMVLNSSYREMSSDRFEVTKVYLEEPRSCASIGAGGSRLSIVNYSKDLVLGIEGKSSGKECKVSLNLNTAVPSTTKSLLGDGALCFIYQVLSDLSRESLVIKYENFFKLNIQIKPISAVKLNELYLDKLL